MSSDERTILRPLWHILGSAVMRAMGRPFDVRYRVRTEGRRQPADMCADGRSTDDAHEYAPSPVRAFWLSVGSLRLDARRFTFIDYGSGMGRTLLLAGRLPYRRIEGVEIARDLNAIAGANIARSFPDGIGSGRFRLHTAEATAHAIPPVPCVIYLYNPFGRETLARLADNIAASYARRPRAIYVVYVNARFRGVFDERGFKPVRSTRLHAFLDRRIPAGFVLFRAHG